MHRSLAAAAAALLLIALVSTLCAQVLVNQSGYNTIGSKRFTAPLAADGTQFSIVTEPGGEVVFSGAVASGVGDFSALEPAATGDFRVLLGSAPDPQSSHVFGIGPFWIERVSYRRMIQFFIDSRCGFGNATTWNVSGGKNSSGIAWRDSHQFSFELRTLIQWYAANPDAFGPDRMPIEGTYTGLRDTLPADTPEIVRLIHWGVDIYLRGNLNHTLIKEELAYFLYYYPLFQQWIPVSLYHEARDYLFPLWGNTARDRWNWYDISHTGNLYQTYTVMGGTKGSFPPGHSIVPNLLMHAVALREGRSDSASYLTAARNQTQWIISNLDPANPLVTKGQRMSEHILVPALVEFTMRDPSGPVTGTDAWLASWADTVIARSNNYWDFRKYSDTHWTPENPGSSSHPWWNEPGNVAGFPASALAAATRLSDPVRIARLRAIAVSQTDQVFGRNPHNRHFSFRATQPGYGFEGVETGWFSQHLGGLGILENTRGVLDASAKHPAFPYNPNVPPGYVEGWVAFNSAWNAAMLWSARDRSEIRFLAPDPQGAVGGDGAVRIRLSAPLNLNRSLAEPAVVRVTSANGDIETVILTETGVDTAAFQGQILLDNTATPASGDGILQAAAGSALTVSYAYDIFTRSASATAADTSESGLIITTGSLPVARAGVAYGPLTLTAMSANPPLTWQITGGRLPAGMELHSDGTLHGTPTEAGVFPLTIRAQDADSQTEKPFTLSCSALAITTRALASASSGVPYSQPLDAVGGLGEVVWSLPSGSVLPAGLTLAPGGTISGTSFAAGQFTVDLTATDDAGVSDSASYALAIFGAPGGVRFTDTFDAGTGPWFKAAPSAGDSLTVVDGELEWKETGAQMSEAIARSFPAVTLAVGQKARLSFDYRQNGSTTNNIVRAGLYQFASPVGAHNWAGGNAVGAWKGYGTFVRDDSSSSHIARVESGASTSGTFGPNNANGFVEIGAETTRFNLNDDGTVTYRFVFEADYVSPTRMDTLLTVGSTDGGTITTHLSIPGSQTAGSIHSSFNTLVLRHAGGSAMPAYFDNLTLEVIGGTQPAWFSDWQDLTWPGVTDETIIGPSADPDFDDLPNLMEWALHLDPEQSSAFLPAMTIDGDFLLYSYTRRKVAPGQVTFHVEWSDTLTSGDWSEQDVVVSPAVPIDESRESVTCSIPLGPESRRFIRLRLQSQSSP
jgi:hypothetical protein